VALYVDIAVGEVLKIGDLAVKLQYKTGKKARLKIEAPIDEEFSLKKDSPTQIQI
jgi:hypothetical protein